MSPKGVSAHGHTGRESIRRSQGSAKRASCCRSRVARMPRQSPAASGTRALAPEKVVEALAAQSGEVIARTAPSRRIPWA